MHNPRHPAYTREAFDKIAKIVCKEKQAEIDALKEYIEGILVEGRELAEKYEDLIFNNAHDLYDYLM